MITVKNAFWRVALPIALAISMVKANHALAEEPGSNVFISSRQIGCEEYLVSASGDQKALEYANAWIEGYLADYNIYVDQKRFILVEDLQNILEWVERYCKMNSTESIPDTIRLFFEELGPYKE